MMDYNRPPVPPRPTSSYTNSSSGPAPPPPVPPLPPNFSFNGQDPQISLPHFEDPLVAPRPHKITPDLPADVSLCSYERGIKLIFTYNAALRWRARLTISSPSPPKARKDCPSWADSRTNNTPRSECRREHRCCLLPKALIGARGTSQIASRRRVPARHPTTHHHHHRPPST